MVALLGVDLAWNAFMPAEALRRHKDRIGVQPGLRPWLTPAVIYAAATLLTFRAAVAAAVR